MLCGTFCAFCACAVQSPSIRSATEAKRDRVFTGDFMVHVSYVAINGATTECTPSCTCPLWVKSRHHGVSNQCPLYPQKRTLRQRKQMSALCQKQTFCAAANSRYSITSSARASSDCGTVSPSAFAVLRLMTSSYLVGA